MHALMIDNVGIGLLVLEVVEKLVYTHSCSLLNLFKIKWKSWLNAVMLQILAWGYHRHYQWQTGYRIMISEDFLFIEEKMKRSSAADVIWGSCSASCKAEAKPAIEVFCNIYFLRNTLFTAASFLMNKTTKPEEAMLP